MSIREIAPAEVPSGHPAAVFHRFWTQSAGGGTWVSWSQFDATEHPGVLPWVLLLKRESDPDAAGGRRWRYVVCGTGCTDLFGFSYEGKLFGAGMPEAAARERLAEFDRVVEGSGPLFFDSYLPIPQREFVRVLRGLFPFSTGGKEVDRLFIVVAREDTRT